MSTSLDWTQIAIAVIGAIMTIVSAVIGLFFKMAKTSIEQRIQSTTETIEKTFNDTKESFDKHVMQITEQLHAIVEKLEKMNDSFNNSKVEQAVLSGRVGNLERLVNARPCVRHLMGKDISDDECPNHFKP